MDKWWDHGEYEGVDQDSMPEELHAKWLYRRVRFVIENVEDDPDGTGAPANGD